MRTIILTSILFLVSCSTEASLLNLNKSKLEVSPTTSEITVKDFKSHIGYLASDHLKGRAPGTIGDEMAKDYIVNFFNTVSQPAPRFVEVQEHYVPAKRTRNIKPEDRTVKTYNIIATLPGNDPVLKDEFIVIGGHYDSTANPKNDINNGADDNASGTSMVMELFEKYAKSNNHKRTLVFMLYGGEELGLLGSEYYVQNPTIDLSKIQLMVNLDMVGRLDNDRTLYLGGIPSATNFEKEINPFLENSDFNIVAYSTGTTQRDNLFSASDHWNFYKSEVPVIFFFTGIHDDYHTPRDEKELVNYEGLRDIADLADKVVGHFSDLNDRLVYTKFDDAERPSRWSQIKVSLGARPVYPTEKPEFKVAEITKDSPAFNAGVKKNDVIKKIGKFEINSMDNYLEALLSLKPGDSSTLTILRKNKEIILDISF